jgi:hypothetical protein
VKSAITVSWFVLVSCWTAAAMAGSGIVAVGTSVGPFNQGAIDAASVDYSGQVVQTPAAPDNYFLAFNCVMAAGPATDVQLQIFPFSTQFSEVTGPAVFSSSFVPVSGNYGEVTFLANSPVELTAGATYLDLLVQSDPSDPSALFYPDYGKYSGGSGEILYGLPSMFPPPFTNESWNNLFNSTSGPADSIGFIADFGTSTSQLPEPAALSLLGIIAVKAAFRRRAPLATGLRTA